jgi:hypothetical protein
MDVASVISQYALEGEINLGFTWQDRNTQTLGGKGKYTDRPTITYNPLMGKEFARSLLTPIPAAAVLLLVQSGYPADHVLRICVQTINGLKNLRTSPTAAQEADPEFYELLDLLRTLQEMDGMAMRFRRGGQGIPGSAWKICLKQQGDSHSWPFAVTGYG